jgi:hydroxymethylglutaryl-CoA lyase
VDKVTIHEVGPRDGLQNEPGVISLPEKLALISALERTGLTHIEVGSFVSPKWVPQMADSDALVAELKSRPKLQYDVLIPNMKGWDRFVSVDKHSNFGIAVFISASEGFSQANLNCSIAQSVERISPVVAAASRIGVPIRGYVSCVTDCPFDGAIPPDQVAKAVGLLREHGNMQISLGDTIGKGTPETVAKMLNGVLDVLPAGKLAGHFHDTNGQAIANIDVSLGLGLRSFDSSAGGLGGCPYAPGAPGNVATDTVVAHLHSKGYSTGVDEAKLAKAAILARSIRKEAREKPTN